MLPKFIKFISLLGLLLVMGSVAADPLAGTLDPSFSEDGKLVTDITYSDSEFIAALTQQSNGKIVAAVTATMPNFDVGLVRYTTNGELDTTFGQGGVITTNVNVFHLYWALAVQPDDKILLVGAKQANTPHANQVGLVARYTVDGLPDASFGVTGVVTTPLFNLASSSIALQPDGKIIVGGEGVLARYETDGDLDTDFSSDGIAILGPSYADSYGIYSIKIQPDGKILAAGFGSPYDEMLIFRYTTEGEPDSTFGINGFTGIGKAGYQVVTSAIMRRSDGKYMLAGYAYANGYKGFLIARLNGDGSPDDTFGTNGVVLTNNLITNLDPYPPPVAVFQPNGQIVICGGTPLSAPRRFILARYNTNGLLDESFGAQGLATEISNPNGVCLAAAIQPDGKILAGGIGGNSLALARYHGTSIYLVYLPLLQR